MGLKEFIVIVLILAAIPAVFMLLVGLLGKMGNDDKSRK